MGDIFRGIKDTNYEVSISGIIRHKKTLAKTRFEIVNGYLKVRMRDIKKKVYISRRVHRVVWEAFIGPIKDGIEIHHKDKNRKNNKLTNLEPVIKSKHRSIEGSDIFTIRVSSLGYQYASSTGLSSFYESEIKALQARIKEIKSEL